MKRSLLESLSPEIEVIGALRLGRLEEAEGHYSTGLEWAEEVRFPVEQGALPPGPGGGGGASRQPSGNGAVSG